MLHTYTDYTWSNGQLVTLERLNIAGRDNFRFLYGGVGFAASKVGQSVPHATGTKMAFVETWDSHNYFDDVTTYRFQPLRAGKYQVTGCARMANVSGQCWVAIIKNGLPSGLIMMVYVDSAADTNLSCGGIVSLNGSTDVLELQVQHSSGGDRSVDAEFTAFRVGT